MILGSPQILGPSRLVVNGLFPAPVTTIPESLKPIGDSETRTGSFEIVKKVHRIHDWKQDYKGSLAARWPPQGRPADLKQNLSDVEVKPK